MFSWHKSHLENIKAIKPKSIFYSSYGGSLKTVLQQIIKSELSRDFNLRIKDNALLSEIASPNFFYLSRSEEKKIITIEQIRAAKDFLLLKTNKKKYLYIDGGQHIRINGYNALLKIAEESDDSVNIWIMTNSLVSIPTTILSRFHKVRFPSPTQHEIKTFLESRSINYDSEILSFLSENPALLEENDSIELLNSFNSLVEKKDIYQVDNNKLALLVDYLIYLAKQDIKEKPKRAFKSLDVLLDVKKSLSLPNNLSLDVIKLRINSSF